MEKPAAIKPDVFLSKRLQTEGRQTNSCSFVTFCVESA